MRVLNKLRTQQFVRENPDGSQEWKEVEVKLSPNGIDGMADNGSTVTISRAISVTGKATVAGAIEGKGAISATGNISGAAITATGNISGAAITASGDLKGKKIYQDGNQIMPININIPANADLNNYKTVGHYRCGSNATVSTLKNVPTGLKGTAFSLRVEMSAGYTQWATGYLSSNPVTYMRNFYNNIWGGWTQIVTELNGIASRAKNADYAEKAYLAEKAWISDYAPQSLHSRYIDIKDIRNEYMDESFGWAPVQLIDNAASLYFARMPGAKGYWKSIFTAKGWGDDYTAWQIGGPASIGESTVEEKSLFYRSGGGTGWDRTRMILDSENTVDYVIETGKANGGYYEKWASGKLVQWGVSRVTSSDGYSNTWGGMYHSPYYDIIFPRAFVGSNPSVTLTSSVVSGGEGWVSKGKNATPLTKISRIYLVRPTAYSGSLVQDISWYAVGDWKERVFG